MTAVAVIEAADPAVVTATVVVAAVEAVRVELVVLVVALVLVARGRPGPPDHTLQAPAPVPSSGF